MTPLKAIFAGVIYIMDIKTYLNEIREKVKHYDKTAQNPFVQKTQFEHNPFAGALSQTYIWVEPEKDGENLDESAE